MVQTVKEFLDDSYQLISPSNPTVGLKGNDLSAGLRILNRLLSSFSGTGLMITVDKEINTPVTYGQQFVYFADSGADVNEGRLANIENAWLELEGVTYPLIPASDHSFNAMYKFEPLKGLPLYAIIVDQTNKTRLQLYPAPSQQYELFVYGKFELASLSSNSDMSSLPSYYQRYLQFATARDLSMYKGRSEAWTEKLQAMLLVAQDDMESVSNMNLNISDPLGNQLNGSYRCAAGI